MNANIEVVCVTQLCYLCCAVFRKPVGCWPWRGSPVRSGWPHSGSWTPSPGARPSCPRWEMRYSAIPPSRKSAAQLAQDFSTQQHLNCAEIRLSFDNYLIPRQFIVYRSTSCVAFSAQFLHLHLHIS